jgi:transketolase
MTNDSLSIILNRKAKVIRRHIIDMIFEAGSGHPGGSLSAADILTVLYFSQLKHDPTNPSWTHRDRFILSKGHCAPVLYAVLAESGYFPKEELKKLRKIGSSLQGHPDMRKTPGVEVSTGSLGQGLSIANGMALGCRMDNLECKLFGKQPCWQPIINWIISSLSSTIINYRLMVGHLK